MSFAQNRDCTITILHGCRCYHDEENETHDVHEQVALSPIDFFPASYPLGPPTSVDLTLWLSIMAAVGSGFRPAATRTMLRRCSWIASTTPSFAQRWDH